MSSTPKGPFEPAIHRVPLDKLTIYEITEAELDALERGSVDSIFLNLAIFAGSIAVSFLISLLTTEIGSIYTFCAFIILTSIGFLAAVTYMLLWWRNRFDRSRVVKDIRKRLPPIGEMDTNG